MNEPEHSRGPRGVEVPLSEVPPGSVARIVRLDGQASFRERLRNMGLREGVEVEIIKQAPLADPIEYRLDCTHLSLRREDARQVHVDRVRAATIPCGRWGGWGRRGPHGRGPHPGRGGRGGPGARGAGGGRGPGAGRRFGLGRKSSR